MLIYVHVGVLSVHARAIWNALLSIEFNTILGQEKPNNERQNKPAVVIVYDIIYHDSR